MKSKKIISTILFLLSALFVCAQNKKVKEYYPPTDILVQQKYYLRNIKRPVL